MRHVPVVLAILVVTAPAAAQELQLPQPAAPEPRVVVEQGTSPIYYRRSPHIALPTIRVNPGLQIRLPIGDVTAKPAFTIDVYLGSTIRFGRGARTGLLVEAGYSYVGFSEHLASMGLGILHGIGQPPTPPGESESLGRPRVALVPHALVGSAYGGTAVGARTSLILGYWVYGVEFAHQILFVGPRNIHEIHLTFTGFNLFGEDE